MLGARDSSGAIFLPTRERGEVAPSYGDGGVVSDATVAHDPSVRFADTSPRFAWGGKNLS